MEDVRQLMSVSADVVDVVEPATQSSMAVAIVNYNTCEHLRACLAALAVESPSQIVVVDNASHDGSADMVRAEYPAAELHANTINLGFGAAANQAVGHCRSKYVLLLNSDTRVQPGALERLSTYLDLHPEVAIAGPRLSNLMGALEISCYPFPTPFNELMRWSTLGVLVGRSRFLRDRYLPTSSHDRPRPVGWVVGAALAIRREAFEAVGGFDESFFMYSEEVDLCYRLNRNGWQIHFAPDAGVVHVGGASTNQYRAKMAAQLYASLRQFYQHHYSRWDLLQLRLIVTYFMLRNLLRDRVRFGRTTTPAARMRIAEDLGIWKTVLASIWHSR